MSEFRRDEVSPALEAPHLGSGRHGHAVGPVLVVRLVVKGQELAAAVGAARTVVRHPAGRGDAPLLLLLVQLDLLLLLLDGLVLEGARRLRLVKHGQIFEPGLDGTPPRNIQQMQTIDLSHLISRCFPFPGMFIYVCESVLIHYVLGRLFYFIFF